MKYLFRLGLLLTLAGAAPLAFSGCSDSKKEDPAPTTGSLSGLITPAGTISRLTATDAGGLTFFATPNANTGTFSLDKLPPGAYILYFEPMTGYREPAPRNINIVAGQKADAGTVTVESDGTLRGGTVSWTVNGVTLSTTSVRGYFTSNSPNGDNMVIIATAPNGSVFDEIYFQCNYFTPGPKAYNFSGQFSDGSAEYRRSGGSRAGTYGTDSNNTGTLNITSFGQGAATGTFNFIARSLDGTNATMTVTNGTFRLQF